MEKIRKNCILRTNKLGLQFQFSYNIIRVQWSAILYSTVYGIKHKCNREKKKILEGIKKKYNLIKCH